MCMIGKGRILEADLWDRDYPDLVEAAHITFEDDGRGEFAFGCESIPAASAC